MKVLVTGAKGQVGIELCQRIEALGWQTIAVDVAELDISDEKAVHSEITRIAPDLVINSAAYTAVDKAESEQAIAYAVNRDGSINLAKVTAELNIPLLHISTDYVFPGDKTGEYTESDPVGPQSIYGLSKLEGDQAIAEINQKYITLRTAWVFGEHGNNFVKTMLRLAERDELGVVADQFGSPTYAGDIAEALLTIAKKVELKEDVKWGTYHFTGYPYVHWAGFAEAIFAQATAQGLIEKAPKLNVITTADYPTPAKRPANSKLDCSLIKNTFGIEPSDWNKALVDLKPYV